MKKNGPYLKLMSNELSQTKWINIQRISVTQVLMEFLKLSVVWEFLMSGCDWGEGETHTIKKKTWYYFACFKCHVHSKLFVIYKKKKEKKRKIIILVFFN